ncbi:hypothetical protein FNH05_22995 [Amycolatopsis rhizosphaerae]|uniref:Transmembrane protein n=1 Tax=Amycolatopsis rhizosphaerae TaxID=2053003 RepID=A0A558BX18_9PSEU|nr:hypothetical protein [Amycolatopsis rhizosphaerae]TVT41042.1 hypothetical protein FNH05_22995 [Amycolatopsis rhizosphaerae]
MSGPFGCFARFRRRIRPGRNPLARRSDRVEAAVLAVVALGLLIALPFAVLLGSNTYRGQLAVAAGQQASRHPVTATLLQDAPTPVPATDGAYLSSNSGSSSVPAHWRAADGTEQTGSIAADPGTSAGTQVPIWLSDSGKPVPAPMSTADAVTTGVLAAAFTWMVAALGLVGLYWIVRLVLDRRRAARWEREWAHAGDRWARS